MFLHQVTDGVDVIGKILPSHVTIDTGAPIASIAGATAIIDVEHHVTALHQQMMEHVLTIVLTPPAMHILQIAGAMDKHYCWTTAFPVRRYIDSAVHGGAIA